MPSLMFDPENWRNAAPIGGGAYQGGGGGLGPGFFPAPAPAVPQAPYMTQPGSGQSPFIPRNGQPPPQMDGGYARLYPQPIPRQVGPPLGRYAQPGEDNWGNPRYMDPRVDAQLAWDAFVADEEANQREYDEAQLPPSLDKAYGAVERGDWVLKNIPMPGFWGRLFGMGQQHAINQAAQARVLEGLDLPVSEVPLPAALSTENYYGQEYGPLGETPPSPWHTTPEGQAASTAVDYGYPDTQGLNPAVGAAFGASVPPPAPVPPLLAGGNFNPLWTPKMQAGLPPKLEQALGTNNQTGWQDYINYGSDLEIARQAEEAAAAAEYQRENDAEDRMREEEEVRIQEALDELAKSSDYATQGTVADYF